MITFWVGILILLLGYIVYSKYVEKQFVPNNSETPAFKCKDSIDYVPLSCKKNMLIHLLNIAGIGPIMGAIQGVLFGPIAFLLIPLGCIFVGGVHDYFSAMISCRNDGVQIIELIKKYIGNNFSKIFMLMVSALLLLVTCVFICSSADIIANEFFNQTDFSFSNPIVLWVYLFVIFYFLLATILPIDKIIAKVYPFFALIFIAGALFVLYGVFYNHFPVPEINFLQLNLHPNKLHIIPMFFMTVSCGLLSGFHSTQATIISRTIENENQGRKIFYGMMCVESLIAMIWALASSCIYSNYLTNPQIFGSETMVIAVAKIFTIPCFSILIILSAIILPITSGDTAIRALRITLADFFKLKQASIINRFKIVVPLMVMLFVVLYWSKLHADSFAFIWRYFTFANQLIAVSVFMFSTVYLYINKKNYLITLLPAIFYTFIISLFILNSNIGFSVDYKLANIIASVFTLLVTIYIIYLCKKAQKNNIQ